MDCIISLSDVDLLTNPYLSREETLKNWNNFLIAMVSHVIIEELKKLHKFLKTNLIFHGRLFPPYLVETIKILLRFLNQHWILKLNIILLNLVVYQNLITQMKKWF